MNHRIPIAELRPENRDECLSVGKIEGEFVELTDEQYRAIRAKYHPHEKDAASAAFDAANGIPNCRGCSD